MRIGWIRAGQKRVLVWEAGGQLFDLPRLAELQGQQIPPVSELLGCREARDVVRDLVSGAGTGMLEQCRVEAETFLAPVRPRQVIAIGLNYRSHADEMGRPYPEQPVVFSKAPSSVTGHLEPVVLPPGAGRVDYEGEVAAVVGRRASVVKARDAASYLAGYTLVNDVTMRDVQGAASTAGLPWFLSKSPDTFCPTGPLLVPVEDVGDPADLKFILRVNGEVRQEGWTGDLIFSIPELVEYVTRFITLEPGDIIATGTPSGVGPLSPGDVVAIESEALGLLENSIVAGT